MTRWKHRLFFALLIPTLFSLAGFALHPFRQEMQNKVNRTISFPELLKDPEKY